MVAADSIIENNPTSRFFCTDFQKICSKILRNFNDPQQKKDFDGDGGLLGRRLRHHRRPQQFALGLTVRRSGGSGRTTTASRARSTRSPSRSYSPHLRMNSLGSTNAKRKREADHYCPAYRARFHIRDCTRGKLVQFSFSVFCHVARPAAFHERRWKTFAERNTDANGKRRETADFAFVF